MTSNAASLEQSVHGPCLLSIAVAIENSLDLTLEGPQPRLVGGVCPSVDKLYDSNRNAASDAMMHQERLGGHLSPLCPSSMFVGAL